MRVPSRMPEKRSSLSELAQRIGIPTPQSVALKLTAEKTGMLGWPTRIEKEPG